MAKSHLRQTVYGLWAVETGGGGYWLSWPDVRINHSPWDQHISLGRRRDDGAVLLFTTRRAEILKVLDYIRERNVPEHVRRFLDRNGTSTFVLPEGVEKIVIRRCELPQPVARVGR